MNCDKCGRKLRDDSVYCDKCGAKVSDIEMSSIAPAAKKPFPLKYIVIPSVILAVTAIVITVLVLVLKPVGSVGTNPASSQSSSIGLVLGSMSSEFPELTSVNKIFVNDTLLERAKFVYTYNAAYGHYFAVAFNDNGENVKFMAVLPEKLCVSGAKYSGNDVSDNGIIFDVVVNNFEYNSKDNPEVFENLSVSITNIEPYQSAFFKLSGAVAINGRTIDIVAVGESEYKSPENLDSSESTSSSSSSSSSSASSSAASSSTESSSIESSSTSSSSEESKPESEKSKFASNTMPEDYSTEPVAFHSTIDAFDKEVKEIPLTDEDPEYYKGNGIALRRLEIDGTQLYEARPNDGKVKALLIQMHGGGWHKEWEVAVDYAVASGFCVVSIDEAGAGDSQDGLLQGPAAYMETVKDIDSIIEYYNTRSDVDASKFGLVGYSMGGTLSFYYVVYGKYKPTAICPCNPSVDLTGEGPAWDCFNKGVNGQTPIWTEEQIWAFTAATAPKNHPEMFTDIWMYICVGAEDDTHSPENVEKFVNSVKALGSNKIVFRRFENVGHETPRSWEQNEQQQFYEKMRNS